MYLNTFLLASFLLNCAVGTSRAVLDSTVTLSYGKFSGNTTGNTTSYQGIPFAAPPVGELRFAPPTAPKSFEGIRQATSFGPACLQQNTSAPNVLPFSMASLPPPANQSEDCLYMNVWKPTTIAEDQYLPVLVFILGGGFENGYASLNDATEIVLRSMALKEPIVAVTFSYRLNAFGFLGGNEIKQAGFGNAGLRDQRFALAWIQDNIAQFGGDPTKVTIWGQSSGAASVGLQLVLNSGNSQGLFRAAVMQSGSPYPVQNITTSQSYYDLLSSTVGCSGQPDTLSCLRAVASEKLLAAVNAVPQPLGYYNGMQFPFQPFIDGDILTENPENAVASGRYAKVPIITGDCTDEGTVFALGGTNVTTDEDFIQYIASSYLTMANSSQIQAVAQAYPADPSDGSPFGTGDNYTLSSQYKRIAAFVGDYSFQAPRRHLLQVASQVVNTWAYVYNRGSSPYLGVYHASDIAEFFSTGGAAMGNDFIATDALINFATKLDPNFAQGISPSNVSYLEHVSWAKWSASSSPTALTFIDPQPAIEIGNDTYREESMNLLTSIMLHIP